MQSQAAHLAAPSERLLEHLVGVFFSYAALFQLRHKSGRRELGWRGNMPGD